MDKATKYLVRNTNGSILAKYDDRDEAEKFFKGHAAALYVEKVTVTTEVVNKKKAKSEIIAKLIDEFDAADWI